MATITTKDGTRIFYKDWGSGQPMLFSHGWPLSADAWDAQMVFFGAQGFRVIAHDRRSHGRSDQTAPFAQFSAAQAALSHAGKTFEVLVKPSEGHGFYKEENRVEAFERIGAFLAKYNPVE